MTVSGPLERAYEAVLAMDDLSLREAGVHDPSRLYTPVITYPAMSMMKPSTATAHPEGDDIPETDEPY